MKTLILAIGMLLFVPSISIANQDPPPCNCSLLGNFSSFEDTNSNGQLAVTLNVKKLNDSVNVQIDSFKWRGLSHYTVDSTTLSTGHWVTDSTDSFTVYLAYDTASKPFYLQEIALELWYEGKFSTARLYIYHTPWNSVEVWAANDLPRNTRQWIVPTGGTSEPSRVYIHPDSIPSLPDTSLSICWQRIKGLAYEVPVNCQDWEEPSGKRAYTYNGNVTGTLTFDYTNDLGVNRQVALVGARIEVKKGIATIGVGQNMRRRLF